MAQKVKMAKNGYMMPDMPKSTGMPKNMPKNMPMSTPPSTAHGKKNK